MFASRSPVGMYGRALALFGVCLALCIKQCEAADPEHTFQWGFANNLATDDFATCQNVPIEVVSLYSNDTSALGTPPYTMIAFELGGIPTVQNIGSDPKNLTWQVNHATGSTLMLTIIDSKNDTGGIPMQLYNVVDGSSTSCIPSKPDLSSVASLSPNVTDNLETCACWGLTVTGGTKPYTIVLSALDSPVITTVPMGDGDDVYTFPNRADPNGQLMASIYDATGVWGVSTKTVHTFGSTDVDCPGLISNSKTKAQVEKQQADAAAQLAAENRSHRRTLILGVVLGITLPLILITAVAIWWWRRRKLLTDHSRGIWDGQDTVVRAWDVPAHAPDGEQPGTGHTEMREAPSPPFSSPSAKNLSSYAANIGTNGYTVPLLSHSLSAGTTSDYSPALSSSDAGPSSGDYSNFGFSAAAATTELSAARRKALEAHGERLSGLHSHGSSASLRHIASGSSQLPPGASPAATPGLSMASLDPDVQPDIIIQHHDGGAGVVHELPPPYIDRSAGGAGKRQSETE